MSQDFLNALIRIRNDSNSFDKTKRTANRDIQKEKLFKIEAIYNKS